MFDINAIPQNIQLRVVNDTFSSQYSSPKFKKFYPSCVFWWSRSPI